MRVPPGVSGGTTDLSTSQVSLPFAWKEEVNRRVAEHRNRKGSQSDAAEARSSKPRHSASRRGAEAAARVAARFAHAPRYSDMLTEEPPTEQSALALQAADQPMFAGLENAQESEPAEMVALERHESATVLAWETAQEPQAVSTAPVEDAPAADPIPIQRADETPAEDTLSFSEAEPQAFEMQPEELSEGAPEETMEAAEPAQPLHANLIEFPRELVATRKIRPRLAEGPYAAAYNAQLSIFEVDPGTISTEPAAEAAPAAPASWTQPEWSGMELDAQPAEELAVAEVPDAVEALEAPVIELAPLSQRVLALVVDVALIGAALMGAAAAFAANVVNLPEPRALAIGAGIALIAITALYVTLFFTLAQATPGMKYARLHLSTFDGEPPTRAQRLRRLATTTLSVLSLGLGFLWSLFDEERLCWHDRLSQTYVRSSF